MKKAELIYLKELRKLGVKKARVLRDKLREYRLGKPEKASLDLPLAVEEPKKVGRKPK